MVICLEHTSTVPSSLRADPNSGSAPDRRAGVILSGRVANQLDERTAETMTPTRSECWSRWYLR